MTEDPTGLHGLLQGKLYFLYLDVVPTSQETQAFTVYYGDSLTFLYVGYVRISQDTQAFTGCNGDSFTFLYVYMFVPYRKRTFGFPRPVTGMVIFLYM
jgi:hypothetical protein